MNYCMICNRTDRVVKLECAGDTLFVDETVFICTTCAAIAATLVVFKRNGG